MKIKLVILTSILALLTFVACEDLQVENTNRPTFAETNLPSTVYATVGSLLNGIHSASHINWWTDDEPLLAWFTAADVGSCSWGNFAMRDISSEPRIAYNNTTTYTNRVPVESYYRNLYGYLSIANDALAAIAVDEDDEVTEPEMCKAVAIYAQAYCLGHLGLFFDKAFVVTEKTDLIAPIDALPYDVVIDSAIALADKVIDICETETFEIPETWLPTTATYTNVEIGSLANTLAARLLTYKSRNATQNLANDWATILDYAENGIQMDYSPIMDGVTWVDAYRWYQVRDGWGRIDMRVINLMDPTMYPWFPASGDLADLPNNGVATSDDARLESDFEYLSAQAFYASRGIYHYSTYRFKRYDEYRDTEIGEIPCIMKWENDMIMAEALVRTGDVPGAAAILNDAAGPRKVRGGLADVAEDETAVLDAIYYEKTIECMLTTEITEFYDMRRRDMLQEGTMLHLPIPAQQLQIIDMPLYTFGGTTGVAGEDYSVGGWDKVSAFYAKSTYGY